MFLPHIICLLVVLQSVTGDIYILNLLAFMEEAVNSCTCLGLEITLDLLNIRISLVQLSMLGKFGQHRVMEAVLDIKLLVMTRYGVEHLIHVRLLGACKKTRKMNTSDSCSYQEQIEVVCCKEDSSNQIHERLYVENKIDIQNDSGTEKIIVTLRELYKLETIIAKANASAIQIKHARVETNCCPMQLFSACNKDAFENLHFETARKSNAWRRKVIFNVLHFIEREYMLEKSWTFEIFVLDENGYSNGSRQEEFDDSFEYSSEENLKMLLGLDTTEFTCMGIFSTYKNIYVYKCTDYLDNMRFVPKFSNSVMYLVLFIFREEEYTWNYYESDMFILRVKYSIFQDEEFLLSLLLDLLQQQINIGSKSDFTICLPKKNYKTDSNWCICQIYTHPKIIWVFRYISERVFIGEDNWQITFQCPLMDSAENRCNHFNLLLGFSHNKSHNTFTDFSQLDIIVKYASFLLMLLQTFFTLCIDKFGDITVHRTVCMVNMIKGKCVFITIMRDLFGYCNYRSSDTMLKDKGTKFYRDMPKMKIISRGDRDVHLTKDDPSFGLSFSEDIRPFRHKKHFERHRDPCKLQKANEHKYNIKSVPWYLRHRPSYFQLFATVLPLSLKEYINEKVNTTEEHRAQLMKYEWERYLSFRNFPSSSLVQPARLAQAGFYYSDVDDEVTCFSCGIKCRVRQYEDLPKERHAQMSPACSFISGHSDNIPIADEKWTQVHGNPPLHSSDVHTQVEDEVNLSYSQSTRNNSPDCSATTPRDGWDDFGEDSDLQSGVAFESSPGNFVLHLRNENNKGIQKCRKEYGLLCGFGQSAETPKHPQYSVLRDRLESFTGWPICTEQKPNVLAEAGLFYTGLSDCVRCFHCGGGLRSWDKEDLPWNEHARWYPNCWFVLRCKGREFIENVLHRQETLSISDATQISQVLCQNDYGASSSASANTIKENVLHKEPVRTVLDMGFPVDTVRTAVRSLQERQKNRSFSVTDLLEVLLLEDSTENDLGSASSKQVPMVRSFVRNITEESEETPDWKVKETISYKEEVRESRRKDAATVIDGKDSETSAARLSQKDYESLMEENRVLKDQMTCKICMDAEACIVFLPCSHMMTCSHCAPAFRKCPMCRQLIRGTVRAHL